MLLGIPRSARCVQRFDDSLNSAIHITYRISLRSSSMREPRDPLLKVVFYLYSFSPPKGMGELTEERSHTKCIRCKNVDQFLGLPEVHRCKRKMVKRCAHALERASNETSFDISIMILPQVHLRKPCYDFYFL